MTEISYQHPDLQTKATLASDSPASIVKEFEWATTELAQVVAEMEARLQPVLRPIGETPDGLSEPGAPISDARQRLVDLHGLARHLRGLLDRLEV